MIEKANASHSLRILASWPETWGEWTYGCAPCYNDFVSGAAGDGNMDVFESGVSRMDLVTSQRQRMPTISNLKRHCRHPFHLRPIFFHHVGQMLDAQQDAMDQLYIHKWCLRKKHPKGLPTTHEMIDSRSKVENTSGSAVAASKLWTGQEYCNSKFHWERSEVKFGRTTQRGSWQKTSAFCGVTV